MFCSLGASQPPILIIIFVVNILFCDISDGAVQKIRYRKIQNPKSNGLFRGSDSSSDIYGFLNRISPPHGKIVNFFAFQFHEEKKIIIFYV